MDPILVSFAFAAGLQAFASCSIALIPAYVGYYVSSRTSGESRLRQLLFGLKAGVMASLGLLTIYALFGALLALVGRWLAPLIPWLDVATGGILLFLGSATLFGYEFSVKVPARFRVSPDGLARFYWFGVAYAFGAIGCTLPIFLLVVFQALAQNGPLGALVNFGAYALAMTSLMIAFSIVAAVSKNALHRFLTNYMSAIQRSAAFLILGAGVYLVYLGLRVLLL